MALELRNELELQLAEGFEVQSEGEGSGRLPSDERNMIVRAVRRLYQRIGRDLPGLRVRATNRIPLAAGLGSSAATVVGALAGAARLAEATLSEAELLELAVGLEGHADNAAASLLGGLVLVAPGPEGAQTRRVTIPPRRVVVVTPDFGLSTAEMREALPRTVPLADAVFNMGRALLVVEALREGDDALLERVLGDRLHQAHRGARIAGYAPVVEAAHAAGALGVTISGAGPSLLAFCTSSHESVGNAMVEAWGAAGVSACSRVLDVSSRGVSVS
jgi:homoserine kinase